MPIRIILADDHIQFRNALRALLDGQPDLTVIAAVGDGTSAVDATIGQACGLQADVVIMDVGMAPIDGVEATRRIIASKPGARVLALSTHDDARFVLAMVDAGARGYVLKGDPLPELLRAIQAVAGGGTYFSPSVAGRVRSKSARSDPDK